MLNNYKREFYLEKIKKYLWNTELIKVLIGQRRVGKSYIMRQLVDFLIEEKKIEKDNIVYINFEIDYLKYQNISKLDEYVKEIKNKDSGRIYLFFDEIQDLEGWEKLVNAYRADTNFDCDIFITGSNANLLSSDLSTHLAWRYISFEIYPFSYKEYLGYFNKENTKKNLLEYTSLTWLWELYKLQDDELRFDFLKGLKDSIILKDIVKKYKLKDISLLEKLFDFLAGNIWNLFSTNSIVKKLKNLWIKTNPVTIWNYLQYLEKAYLIHSVSRFDLQWKRILEWEKKFFLTDLAFNNFFFSSYDFWKWKHLENLVYLQLKRLGYNVYVWNIKNLEIDFIAEKWKEKLYIQVAYLINSEEVLKREFWNLLKIDDNFEKIVLSLDDVTQNYEWVKHLQIWEYLNLK